MTTKRDPDRTLRAWLDLMPDQAPDRVLSAVSQAVETTPQVRRPLGTAFRRSTHMNRFSLVAVAAAAAAVVVVVGASLFLLRPSSNIGGPPAASPTGSRAAAAFAAGLRWTWIADAGPIAGLGNTDPRIRLVIDRAGTQLSVITHGAANALITQVSRPVASATSEMDLAADATAAGCTAGDAGKYRTTLSSDGIYLTLALVSDACTTRAGALARTWARSLDGPSEGGRVVVAAFDPSFLITLPTATYTGDVGSDAASLTSATPDRTFIAVKNPAGYSDPCSTNGGAKVQIPHTIAAFSAYLDALPGLTVQSATIQIDGRPAAHLTIPVATPAECASGKVNEWTQGDVDTSGGWLIRNGDTDVVYLVQVDSDLVLLQWLGAGVTTAEEQALWATVRFIDTLADAR